MDAATELRAQAIAEEVLWPAAAEVDRAERVPAEHLDLLAAEGFYAPFQPPGVVEVLASGCLTTAFVWLQHQGPTRAVATGPLRDTWLRPLASGRCRAGVAHGGVLPGPARVRARRVPGGYRITGESPWVTGWGMIDVLHTAARDDRDVVIWALLDAVAGDTLEVRPLRLAAVAASRTVTVRFTEHFVPDDRITGTLPYAEWPARDAAGLRTNGSLALGLVDRCVRLLDPAGAALRDAQDAARTALDAAGPDTVAVARAGAAALAMRAAAALAVATGSAAVLAGAHAERLLREALFLQVFGSRPGIRAALLEGYIGRAKSWVQ